MASGKPFAPIPWSELKGKQRSIRDGFPDALGLRVQRALSWLHRAERETGDADVRFILLWVGFNAAYARELSVEVDEREKFAAYFDALVKLDTGHRVYNAVWDRFSQEVRVLLGNRYVFMPFWKHHNGVEGYDNWAESLAASRRLTNAAMAARDTPRILAVLFDRLYVLRNQLVHGGATWNSIVNRGQVQDGAAILGWLLPVFIDIMMDNPKRDWGRPFYPVVD